jgi:hypothetical protein
MPVFGIDLRGVSLEELDAASKEYDLIYQEACDLITEFDPCKVENGECVRARESKDAPNFCCGGCKHLSSEGCAVKAIWCKLWFCHGWGNFSLGREFSNRLRELRKRVHRLPRGIKQGGRLSKEELFSYYE